VPNTGMARNDGQSRWYEGCERHLRGFDCKLATNSKDQRHMADAMSLFGTFETCRPALTVSVVRVGPEVADREARRRY
jgi:hypothetical protein